MWLEKNFRREGEVFQRKLARPEFSNKLLAKFPSLPYNPRSSLAGCNVILTLPMAVRCPAGSKTLIGDSEWVRTCGPDRSASPTARRTVLVSGPTGTGKELIARAIPAVAAVQGVSCRWIPRRRAGNCSPDSFRACQGAFTGAEFSTRGCFRAANGGTLLLDEIGELRMRFQSKLLRVLQDHTVTPLGSHKEMRVDVRIIAATNRDLERGGSQRSDSAKTSITA